LAVVVVFPTPPLPLVMTIARPRTTAGSGIGSSSTRAAGVRRLAFKSTLTRFPEREEPPEKRRRAQVRKGNDLAAEPARDLVVDRGQRLVSSSTIGSPRLVVSMTSSSSGTTPSNSACKISQTSSTDIMSPVFTISGRMRLTIKRSGMLRGELADHAVGVADRADLRRRHDDRFARARDGVAEAVFDARPGNR
jgi:hypothetical protein